MIECDLISCFEGRILCGSQFAVNRITAGADWSDDLARRLLSLLIRQSIRCKDDFARAQPVNSSKLTFGRQV